MKSPSWARVASACLGLAGLAQIGLTLSEPEFNTGVGIAIGVVLLGLGAFALTRKWWILGLIALISGLLTVAAIGQLTDRLKTGTAREVFRIVAFQALLLTASVSATVGAAKQYRSGIAVQPHD